MDGAHHTMSLPPKGHCGPATGRLSTISLPLFFPFPRPFLFPGTTTTTSSLFLHNPRLVGLAHFRHILPLVLPKLKSLTGFVVSFRGQSKNHLGYFGVLSGASQHSDGFSRFSHKFTCQHRILGHFAAICLPFFEL
jgi:hypothetical protein